MAKRFVIAAGGTGSMCVRSMIFLLACGCGNPTDEYNILLVDKDKDSDALTACQNLIKDYRQLRDCLKGTQAFIMPEIRLSSWDFTSEICTEYTRRTGKSSKTLSHMTLSALLNPTGNKQTDDMLKTFYTGDELNVDLDKGFYGHPNIGAAVFAYVQERFLAPAAKDEDGNLKINQFMTELRSELVRGTAYVYLYGSVFGGTGASVIPNIVEALRSIHGDQPGTDWGKTKLVLGGSLLMPYFRLPQCPQDSVENVKVRPRDTLFAEQTREALRFYEESNMVKHMTNLTLVGTKRLDETSEIYARGADQHQHFHIALQAAAVAGCRFFNDALPGMDNLVDANGNVTPPGNLLIWKIAPNVDPTGAAKYQTLSADELGMNNEFQNMNKFFRYSVVIAYYMSAKFDIDSDVLAKDAVICGTVLQMRDENNKPLKLADPKKIIPTSEDVDKYYKAPVQLACSFCREFLKYYFDIAMSGYSWSAYHKISNQDVTIDKRTYRKYEVTDDVNEDAMDASKLANRWCDLINLPMLQRALTAASADDVVNTMTLHDMMSFAYMDSTGDDDGRPQCDLNGFDGNIGTIYEDDTLKQLKLIRKGVGIFQKIERTNVEFAEVFDELYKHC